MGEDPTTGVDEGPTLEEAKEAAAAPAEPVPGAEDLPDDVKSGTGDVDAVETGGEA